jgi:hypothetical protein
MIQENGDGYCRADGVIENEHAGHQGDGYVNVVNEYRFK